jgi:hypothetical protein
MEPLQRTLSWGPAFGSTVPFPIRVCQELPCAFSAASSRALR